MVAAIGTVSFSAWIILASGVVVLVTAIVNLMVSLTNHNKLSRLEVSINGRLTQLLASQRTVGELEGAEKVHKEQRDATS